MKGLKIIAVNGFRYVLTDDNRGISGYDYANFEGTGMALCGRLMKGENLEDWNKRMEKHRKNRSEKELFKLFKNNKYATAE